MRHIDHRPVAAPAAHRNQYCLHVEKLSE
jgi:hypothetical protein